MDRPETRYARNGDLQIAYQVVGEGPLDIVVVPAWVSNIEIGWELRPVALFVEQLASFGRVILFDRRGCGMSDGVAGVPLDEQIDDVRAVVHAAGAEQPVLLSMLEGCALAVLYAASHPDDVRALAMISPNPRATAGPGYEWAQSTEQRAALIRGFVDHWGSTDPGNSFLAALGAGQDRVAWARWQRLALGPASAAAALAMHGETDVRGVLPSVQCPALVLRPELGMEFDARHSRYVAEHTPGAQYVETPGAGPLWFGQEEAVADEIRQFLTGARRPVVSDRVLATVLFTDIVRSTERAATLGDSAWRALLGHHDVVVREEVERHRGRVIKSLGDGALALFDGPSRAISSAIAIRDRVAELDLDIRAGLHTGECELLADDDVGGLAVHLGARICGLAGAGEVLVSSTVRDLSMGSDHVLTARGEHALKGVPGTWRVFLVDR